MGKEVTGLVLPFECNRLLRLRPRGCFDSLSPRVTTQTVWGKSSGKESEEKAFSGKKER